MTRPTKVFLYLMVAAIILIAPRISFAEKNVSILRIHPAPDGGKYVNVEESNTLKKWKFNVGIFFDYAFEPLEFATTDEARRRGIIDDVVTANVHAAVAFTNWFTVGADFPLVIAETFWDPFVPAADVTKQTNRALFGDAMVEMKFRLLDIERFHFGISIIPFLYLPTGNTKYFLGTGMWSPGAMLALDGNIRNRLFLSLNAGYRMYQYTPYLQNDLNPNAVLDDSIILNLGANVRLSDSWAILGEVISESVISGFWKNKPQNPAEFLLGMRYSARDPKGLAMTLTGGGGITHGVGSPDYRFLLGVSYRRPQKQPPPVPVEVVVEEKIAIAQRIHFEFDRAVIRPVSYQILHDVVQLLLQNQQIRLVRVEGHTDWIGSDTYNLQLSERRANAVRDFLISNGISYDRLISAGYGESRPIADNNTVVGRARNRRTEFTVIQTGDKNEKPAAVIPPPAPLPVAPPPAAPPLAPKPALKPAPKPAPAPAPKPAPSPAAVQQPAQPAVPTVPSTKYGEPKTSAPSQTTPSGKYGESKSSAPSQTTPSTKYGEQKTSTPSETTPSGKYGEPKTTAPSQTTPSTKYGTTPEAKPSTSSNPKSKY